MAETEHGRINSSFESLLEEDENLRGGQPQALRAVIA